MSAVKTVCTTQAATAEDTDVDSEVMRIAREVMVEYRVTLEALAKSEAEDRKNACKAAKAGRQ